MLTIVLLGFFLSLILIPFGRFLKGKAAYLFGLIPLAKFIYFASYIPRVASEGSILTTYEWVPSLGVNLGFHLDGLSLIFALMITGIGALVFFYTAYYLKGQAHLDRFYGYLSTFMAAMLGMVLADNLLTIFVFWELTTVTSFFLIGYLHFDAASRRASLISLGVTGLGGMALFGGLLLMGHVSGESSISALLQWGFDFQNHPWYLLTVILIFGAAFTKSAQFPFHFWLGHAMAAPTPVSTYLHSATMVKAGVYILLRFTPLLGGTAVWNDTLLIVGGITMVYAAVHTIFRTDLKAILAYSTVAALGILVFLTGLGTVHALSAAVLFIVVHAIYKGGLFLVVGGIDKATGTRDVTRLRGLGPYMWPLALAGFFLAVMSAGFPPTLGFIGKELIMEATTRHAVAPWIVTGVAVAANAFLLYAGFVVGIRPFFGKRPPEADPPKPVHPMLWVPPTVLALLGLYFGIFPGHLQAALIEPAVAAFGENLPAALKLWHGMNPLVWVSLGTFAIGLILYFAIRPSHGLEDRIKKLDFISPERLIQRITAGFLSFSRSWTEFFQTGYLRHYIITIVLFFIGVTGYQLLEGSGVTLAYVAMQPLTVYEVGVTLILVVAVMFIVFSRSRLIAVAAMGVLGYSISLIFVFYSAPDLAMTQFSVDTLTVILFMLVLYRLPKYLNLSDLRSRIRDGAISLLFGTLIVFVALEVLAAPTSREISKFFAENSYKLAHGRNVVNVLLVDFRGMDTIVEITVLTIAAIGVFGLLKLHIKTGNID